MVEHREHRRHEEEQHVGKEPVGALFQPGSTQASGQQEGQEHREAEHTAWQRKREQANERLAREPREQYQGRLQKGAATEEKIGPERQRHKKPRRPIYAVGDYAENEMGDFKQV